MSHAIGGGYDERDGRHARQDNEFENDRVIDQFDEGESYDYSDPNDFYRPTGDGAADYDAENVRRDAYDDEPVSRDVDDRVEAPVRERREVPIRYEEPVERDVVREEVPVPVEKKRSIWPLIGSGLAGLVLGSLITGATMHEMDKNDEPATETVTATETVEAERDMNDGVADPAAAVPFTQLATSGDVDVRVNYVDEPASIQARNPEMDATIVPSREGLKLVRVNADVTNNGDEATNVLCGAGSLPVSIVSATGAVNDTTMENGWTAADNTFDCETPLEPGATGSYSWIFEVPVDFQATEFRFSDGTAPETVIDVKDAQAVAPAPAAPVADAPAADAELAPVDPAAPAGDAGAPASAPAPAM